MSSVNFAIPDFCSLIPVGVGDDCEIVTKSRFFSIKGLALSKFLSAARTTSRDFWSSSSSRYRLDSVAVGAIEASCEASQPTQEHDPPCR